MAVRTGIPANYDPENPTILVGPLGVTLRQSTGVTASIEKLDIRPTPPGFGIPIAGYGYYDTRGNEQQWFLLPLRKDTCIAVFWRAQIHAWYYFEVVGQEYVLLDYDEDSLWQVRAFCVSETKTKQIDVPSALEENLKQVYPLMTFNSSIQYTGAPFFYPTIPPLTLPSFNRSLWRNSGRYGDYSEQFDTLARQFGIGNLTSNHRGTGSSQSIFYSPAVYRFITGPMVIDSRSRSYSYMRQNYYPYAPNYYVGPCQIREVDKSSSPPFLEFEYPFCTTEKTGFDLTRDTPVDISTPVNRTTFSRKKQYDVKLNDEPPGPFGSPFPTNQVIYAWNWDQPGLCQRRALNLGFTEADLKL
jgi:hypothetical protein